MGIINFLEMQVVKNKTYNPPPPPPLLPPSPSAFFRVTPLPTPPLPPPQSPSPSVFFLPGPRLELHDERVEVHEAPGLPRRGRRGADLREERLGGARALADWSTDPRGMQPPEKRATLEKACGFEISLFFFFHPDSKGAPK